jgi:DNA-binding response OmpR family regulator
VKDCPRCVQLTRELREARELIAEYERPPETRCALANRVSRWLGVPCHPQAAKMLVMLLEQPGKIVHRDALIHGVDYNGDADIVKVLQVQASRVRVSLVRRGLPRAIQSAKGSGYYIEKSDADVIRSAMERDGI